jgi:hypothetical protein
MVLVAVIQIGLVHFVMTVYLIDMVLVVIKFVRIVVKDHVEMESLAMVYVTASQVHMVQLVVKLVTVPVKLVMKV